MPQNDAMPQNNEARTGGCLYTDIPAMEYARVGATYPDK